jgi:hypothetical protein
MYKIKIKSPTIEGQILTFTTDHYDIQENTISFTDREGKKQEWHLNQFITAEEVKA